ncbi:glutamine amidotransferase [Massilia sp. KIM]|uniref:glutamine amidotransferase n=1 Tax=Massilia sp. KIM TaxID=1955422 RepID=UPI0009901B74|nr:glutamine amidotransferase [Massilia sp. KIM]OON63527.1 glutamine amidotransferase [Massilia sp. KIM]
MKCIAVYHVAFENLGSFAVPLAQRGYQLEYRHAGTDPLSKDEWEGADLVVVLGGPIGVGDVAAYPWLEQELDGLCARLALRRPTLGVCLGAQLMAAALGGRVERRAQGGEIGWSELALGDADSLLDPLAGLPVLHWHGDNIVPPPQAATLASTPGTPCQAFTVGEHALGLQFHAEFEGAQLEAWLVGHTVELGLAGIDLGQLRADSARHAAALERAGAAVLQGWLDGIPSFN